MSKLTLCTECNGTGRRGLHAGTVRAYKTCAACDGTGKMSVDAEPPDDPRERHTLTEERRRRKHGGVP